MFRRRKPKRDQTIREKLAHGPVDLPFLMLVMLLLGFGIIMMFSASYATAYYTSGEGINNNPLYYVIRQSGYAVVGILCMYLVSRYNYENLRPWGMGLLGISIILLILVLPFGVGRNTVGAQRWLKMFVFFGPTYQPSEIAKIAVILSFSAKLSKRGSEKPSVYSVRKRGDRFMMFLDRIGFKELLPYGIVLVIILALMYKEPHMSGMILVLVGAASVLFISGISLKWFISLGAGAAAVLAFLIFATDYMTSRVQLWRNPWLDPQGKGYQVIQSIYAIASGGLLGLGFGKSRQKMLYIPEPQNDFVFPIVIEELGLVGGLIVMLLFSLLILRGYWIALHARDRFGTMITVGIITLLAVQVFLNIGVVSNLIPNTGISLPFFSFGGTALVIHLVEMGIVLSVSRQIPAAKND